MSRALVLLAVLLFAAVVLPDTPKPAGPATASAPATGVGSIITLGQSPADEAENKAVRQKLLRRLEKVEIADARLEDVIQAFREQTGLNVYVKWGAFQAVGIDRKTPVNIKLANLTAATALATILEDVGGVNPLGDVIDQGVVKISTRDDLAKETIIRIYDVSDLIAASPLTPDEKAVLTLAMERVLKERKPDPMTAPRWDGGSLPAMPPPPELLPSMAEVYQGQAEALASAFQSAMNRQRANDLLEMLRTTIDPSSWRENNGTIGSARLFTSGRSVKLIVVQNRENQRQIEELLDGLRGRAATAASMPAEKPSGSIVLKGNASAAQTQPVLPAVATQKS